MVAPFKTATVEDILTVCQQAASELGQSNTFTTLNSSNIDIKRWRAAAEETGRKARHRCLWPYLYRRFLLTGDGSVKDFALPKDFNRQVFDTMWSLEQFRRAIGPMTFRDWEALQNGVATAAPYMQFKVYGAGTSRLHFYEAPANGEVIVMPYQTLNWIQPTTEWSAGLSVMSGDYVHYEGNVYRAEASGTTGSNPPVHQSGSESDGGISFAFSRYELVVENTAIPLIDQDVMIKGTQWRWLRLGGFEYESYEKEYNELLRKRLSDVSGAETFLCGNGRNSVFFGWDAVPQTGWGGES